MNDLARRMLWERDQADAQTLLHREWLVTNGLGGYASGTLSGVITRRYHGLLIAALPGPLGRMVMFNHLTEQLLLADGRTVQFGGEEGSDREVVLHGLEYLREFRLEMGLPVWRYAIDDTVLEKRLLMPYRQNTIHIQYTLLAGSAPLRLELSPALHFRPHEVRVNEPLPPHYRLAVQGNHYEISAGPEIPTLRLLLHGQQAALTFGGGQHREIGYRVEADRGYESCGLLWTPGFFSAELSPGQDVALVASTEQWNIVTALTPDEALTAEHERRQRLLDMSPGICRQGPAAELVLAADQFLITPAGRAEETARARAAGDEVGTVIAGYHWFTDWGRDTMISLEGLTLTTGRHREAGWILRTFAHYIRDGLIPNLFPEGQNEGLYHTADATLWFFHAIDRYLQTTGDRRTLRLILPRLRQIVEHHRRGTRFGIGVDADDGLLRQGQEGYQLTWMDAKVGDWVVTPRRGKAVEINALWYNALRLLEGWLQEEQGEEAARPIAEQAEQVRASFNGRFWYAEGGYLYDLVDGEQGSDPACRPNQLFAFSLRHPVLDEQHWPAVLDVVRQRLLTPVGLRSLAPGHRDYKPKYFGDIRARDAAYHQGTVWGWLIGPFIDAWLRVHPHDRAGARAVLEDFLPHLDDACIGSLSEVFDAEAPFTPRGCIAQAWSVAELLRCWVKTAEGP
jgi:predicted glycogen debranching enzyme